MRSGERLIGVIQPSSTKRRPTRRRNSIRSAVLAASSNMLRSATAAVPDADGRRAFPLDRGSAERPPLSDCGRRLFGVRRGFLEGAGEAAVDRDDLIAALKRFAEVDEIKVVWSDIRKASNEALVNGLSMMSPCGPREKQALLEAKDLKSRAEMLVAITTIELARGQDAATQIH